MLTLQNFMCSSYKCYRESVWLHRVIVTFLEKKTSSKVSHKFSHFLYLYPSHGHIHGSQSVLRMLFHGHKVKLMICDLLWHH